MTLLDTPTAVSAPPAAPPAIRRALPGRRRQRAFLAMVAVLPLHTVFLSGWISWKPFLALLLGLVVWDAVDGARSRSWPWHRAASAGLAVFLLAMAASWPGPAHAGRFASLLLGLAAGGAVLLVTERSLRAPGMLPRVLRTVYWGGAAMAATAAVFTAVALGAFGRGAGNWLAGLPGVWRVVTPVYLDDGSFVALTNWHNDPGYAAAWMNLWLALTLLAVWLGTGSRRRGFDALVTGGLAFGVLMTFSRNGWATLALMAIATSWLAVRAGGARLREVATLLAGTATVVALLLGGAFLVDRPGVDGELDQQFSFRFEQRASLATDTTPTGPGRVPDDRATVWPEYWDAFRENPVRGIGLGTGWERPDLQEPHSLPLQLLAETGFIGMAGFLVLLAIVLGAGSGLVGRVALVAAFLPAVAQTVVFEPTWWFAAGLLLAGGTKPVSAPDPYRAPPSPVRAPLPSPWRR